MLLSEIQTYTLSHKANVPFSSAASIENSLAFITDKGIDILELAPDLRSLSPNLGCRRYVVKIPSELPTSDVGIPPSKLLPHLDKGDAYSLLTDVTASPIITRTLPPVPAPKCVDWSPLGIIRNHRCIFSVLTDAGGFFLYCLENYEYCKKASVSEAWLQHCTQQWKKDNKLHTSERLAELKARTSQVKLTAMCWLNVPNDGVGWFATASKSGLVALWKVEATDTLYQDLTVTWLTEFDSTLKNIVRLHWTILASGNSLLTVAALDGRVLSFTLSSTLGSLTVLSTQEVWVEQDRIACSYLISWPWCSGVVLVAVKGAFVIVFYLTSSGEKVSYAAYRSCDVTVNGLTKVTDDEMMVVTRSCKFSSLVLSLTDSTKLELTVKDVESYINISHMGCYSVNVSSNSVLCFIMLSVNQAYDHLLLREPTQVVICSLAEPRAHLEDPKKPASCLSDCLELLRVQILRRVHSNDITFCQEDVDIMSKDQLILALWQIIFALNTEEDETQQKVLAALQNEIETLVLSCHFFKRIIFLLESSLNSSLQRLSLGLLNSWLNKIQDLSEGFSNALNTGRTLSIQIEEKAKQLSIDLTHLETCDICGDEMGEQQELLFSCCKQGHRLPRCSLSLVQCSQVPYYVCSQCGVVAHSSAVEEECNINCILCSGVLRLDTAIL